MTILAALAFALLQPVTLRVIDFALGASTPATIEVPKGGSSTASFAVTGLGSFDRTVTLGCQNPLGGISCAFAPAAFRYS